MPEYRHPAAERDDVGAPPARVHVDRATNAVVAADGTFVAPEPVGAAVAERFGTTAEAIRVPQEDVTTCGDLKASTAEGCSRAPGWGTDSDSGPCTDHLPDDEGDA